MLIRLTTTHATSEIFIRAEALVQAMSHYDIIIQIKIFQLRKKEANLLEVSKLDWNEGHKQTVLLI